MTGLDGRDRLSAENPYPGLQPFGEEDRAYFHGRRAELAELYRLVRRAILTTVFGKSGLGKTSLLNAALFPRLRADGYLPIPARLDFGRKDGSLTAQIRDRISSALVERRVDGPSPGEGEPLWAYFHRAELWDEGNHLLVPTLVLDQAEEIFTLGRDDPRVKDFLVELADLVENRVPSQVRAEVSAGGAELAFPHGKQRFKMVLCLREDYLAQLEGLRRLVPSLGSNRFRLTEMNGAQALEAVLGPADEIVSREVAWAIVRFAAGAARGEEAAPPQDPEALSVEPALLALVCKKLNDRRVSRRGGQITREMLQGERDRIYADFYEESLRSVSPASRRFIEERLITATGFRTAAPVEEAVRAGATDRDIATLVNRRALRLEPRLGIPHVELIHDVLAGIALECRTRRREAERRRRFAGIVTSVGAGIGIAVALLALWALHERRLRSAAEAAEAAAVAALRQADEARKRNVQTVSFVFDLSDQLRGLGRPDLFGRISLYLGEYSRGFDESHDDEFTALTRKKVLYFDGLAYLERGDRELSLERFREYLDAVEGSLARSPSDLWRLEAAKTRELIGDLLLADEKPRDASEQFGMASASLMQADASVNPVEREILLARLLSKRGDARLREEEYAQASASYEEARQHLERIAAGRGKEANPVVLQALADLSARVSALSTKSGRPASEKERALAFVNEFMKRSEGPSVEALAEIYADSVNYYPGSPYGKVDADRAFISADKKRYFGRWPNLKYTLLSDVEVSTEGDLRVLAFRYSFDAFNKEKGRYLVGEARNVLKVRESTLGWKIVFEAQEVLSRQKKE